MENTETMSEIDSALVEVLLAARLFLAVRGNPKNPFVKQIGHNPLTEEAAVQALAKAVENVEHIIQADAKLIAEMSEIDAEEEAFEEENKSSFETG